MKKELMVGFRISLYEVTNPKELALKLNPDNRKSFSWIPQTLSDQIWLWIEFYNEDDKQQYIDNLEPVSIVKKYILVKNGKETDVIKESVFDPKKNFMHNESWMTQERIDHWASLLINN